MGSEPTSEALEALDKTLKAIELAALSFSERQPQLETRWKLKAVTDCYGVVCPFTPSTEDSVARFGGLARVIYVSFR